MGRALLREAARRVLLRAPARRRRARQQRERLEAERRVALLHDGGQGEASLILSSAIEAACCTEDAIITWCA
jgi:hypothetical protein